MEAIAEDPALTAQYDVEADPAANEIRQRYRDASRPIYGERPCIRDVSYGSHPRETFDFFPAATKSDLVYVFIHGGYWKGGAKEERAFLVPKLSDRGWNFVTVEYPVRPDASVERILQAIGTMWKALPTFLAKQGITHPRIMVVGHSAGAHLAATSIAELDASQPAHAAIEGGVLVSGLFDLRPLRRTEAQTWLALTEQDAARLSPITRDRFGRCRFLVVFGGNELAGFHRQSEDFHAHLQRTGHSSALLVSPNDCHFSVVAHLNDLSHPLGKAAQELLPARHH